MLAATALTTWKTWNWTSVTARKTWVASATTPLFLAPPYSGPSCAVAWCHGRPMEVTAAWTALHAAR